MLKRSLLVLALLTAGIVIGAAATGVLEWRDGLARAHAISIPVPPAAATPVPAAPEAPPAQAAPPPAQGARIGVVNLKQCFDENNYGYYKDQVAIFNKSRQDSLAKLRGLEQKLKDLQQQLEGIKDRESGLYRDKIRELRFTEATLEWERKVGRNELMEKRAELLMAVYNEIRKVIQVWAKDRYDLVLFADKPEIDEDTPLAFDRTVLYSNPQLDVTKQVLEVLNADHAKKRTAGDGTPGECATCKIKTNDVKCPKCGGPVRQK